MSAASGRPPSQPRGVGGVRSGAALPVRPQGLVPRQTSTGQQPPQQLPRPALTGPALRPTTITVRAGTMCIAQHQPQSGGRVASGTAPVARPAGVPVPRPLNAPQPTTAGVPIVRPAGVPMHRPADTALPHAPRIVTARPAASLVPRTAGVVPPGSPGVLMRRPVALPIPRPTGVAPPGSPGTLIAQPVALPIPLPAGAVPPGSPGVIMARSAAVTIRHPAGITPKGSVAVPEARSAGVPMARPAGIPLLRPTGIPSSPTQPRTQVRRLQPGQVPVRPTTPTMSATAIPGTEIVRPGTSVRTPSPAPPTHMTMATRPRMPSSDPAVPAAALQVVRPIGHVPRAAQPETMVSLSATRKIPGAATIARPAMAPPPMVATRPMQAAHTQVAATLLPPAIRPEAAVSRTDTAQVRQTQFPGVQTYRPEMKLLSGEPQMSLITRATPTASSLIQHPGSLMRTPGSPIRTPGSPIRAPASPIRTSGSPIRTPASPIRTSGSPIRTPASPIRTPGSPAATLVRPIPVSSISVQPVMQHAARPAVVHPAADEGGREPRAGTAETVQVRREQPPCPAMTVVTPPVAQVAHARVAGGSALVTPPPPRSPTVRPSPRRMVQISPMQRLESPPFIGVVPVTHATQPKGAPQMVTPSSIKAQPTPVQTPASTTLSVAAPMRAHVGMAPLGVRSRTPSPANIQRFPTTALRQAIPAALPATRATSPVTAASAAGIVVQEQISAAPVQPVAEAASEVLPADVAVRGPACLSSQDVDEIIRQAFGDTPPDAQLRQPPGTWGRKIELISNLFQVILPKGNVYHYDVEVRAQGATQEEPVPETIKARCASTLINRRVIEALSRTYATDLDNCKPAFDGRKNLYTRRRLSFLEKLFVVEIEDNGCQRQFQVRVRYAATVSLDPIWAMYEKKAPPEMFQEAIQAADVILRTGPSLSFVPVGRSFFSPPKKEDGDCNLGGSRQLWFGFYTSIRLGVWKPLVNVDMSATAFFVSGPLIDLARDILDPGRRQPNLFNSPLSEKDRLQLFKEIRTIKIRVLHHSNQRQHRIENVTRLGANLATFDLNGTQVSVADYIEDKYKLKLKFPWLPCVEVGKRCAMLPIECCEVVPGQHCRRKLSEIQTKAMIKKTAVAPRDRFRRLMEASRQLHTTAVNHCDEFGMKINTVPVNVEARVLEPPLIKYAADRHTQPSDGVWSLRATFLKPAMMKTWAIAVLGDVRQENIKAVVQHFQREGGKLGMQIAPPVMIYPYGNRATPQRMLEDVKSKVPDVQITLVMLSRFSDYGLIKATAETSDLCMRTQCVKDSNVNDERKFNGIFAQNLLQKINTKLGGINNGIAGNRPQIMKKPFMFVGIDVNHPGPGDTGTPSVAAVVASMDSHPAQYYAISSVQRNKGGNRVEWVVGLKAMFLECLQVFHSRNRCLPSQVVIYRDGISEGMFDAVRLFELAELRSACTDFESNYRPPMMFIVVQKRHHVRFMPSNPRDGVGKSGNIPPGVVVDSKLVHPNMFDFYLCSHQGIQGTSRPTHYHVVHDDADNSPDEIYQLSYLLCHTYARCTRSVSLPAPAYYAHLVAFRAKEHIKGVIYGGRSIGSDNGSSSSSTSSDEDVDLAKFSQAIKVNSRMRERMYFV